MRKEHPSLPLADTERQRRIRRELIWAHEHTHDIARSPVGVVGRDGAQDDVWPRTSGPVFELFVLDEVLL